MKLDKNGDSEGNFSVLAFRELSNDAKVIDNFSCKYQMRPVGQFYQSDQFPVSEFIKLFILNNNETIQSHIITNIFRVTK